MSSPRTVVLCGKSWIACNSMAYLHDIARSFAPNLRLAGVCVAADEGVDSWEPSFRKLCQSLEVEILDSLTALRLSSDDVLFSLQYDRIIRIEHLGGARAFNLHFSPLPRYRGCYPSIWPLRNGEIETGVTLHVLTAGIDDGDIVDQHLFPILPSCTAFDLYREYHAAGYEVFKRALPDILTGHERTRTQSPELATYYNRQSIDFSALELSPHAEKTATECLNFLRSLIFAPYQLPLVYGRRVTACELVSWPLVEAQLVALAAQTNCSPDSAILRCKDGLIRVMFEATPSGS